MIKLKSLLSEATVAKHTPPGYDLIYGGIWSDGRVVARNAKLGNLHTIEMGRNRWIYDQSRDTVFWWSTPDFDSKDGVLKYLNRLGYNVEFNQPMSDYYGQLTGGINELTTEQLHDKMLAEQWKQHKKLLMEAKQDESALDFLKQMVRKGPFNGKVYLAGGAVRDMIRGDVPKDLDLVVTDNGKEGGMKFATWLAQQMGNYKEGSNPVLFPNFGTAKVVLTGIHNGTNLDGFDVECVFARKEVYTPGSRKPEVFPGTIQDDAFRRDFTVNSMMLDLTTDQILDITGRGRSDIAAGIIQTTSNPDEIFGQDALRMFRAIRFATKYKWKIDPATWEGIKKNLNNLDNTSKERVRDELDKILTTKDPAYGIRLLRDAGLLPHITPELQQAVGMTQNKHHSEDVFSHTMTVLSKTKPILINRIGALLHDIGKVATRTVVNNEVHFYNHENIGAEMARKILTDLKYPLDIINPVVLMIKNHMRLKQAGKEGEKAVDKTLRKFVVDLGDHLENILDIIHSDNVAHSPSSSMPNQIPNLIKRIETLKNTIPIKGQKLPISGEDLRALGLAPGPLFKELLDLVKDRQLEFPNTTKEEYLEMIKTYIKNEK